MFLQSYNLNKYMLSDEVVRKRQEGREKRGRERERERE
jgi:hypothetical protein